MYTLAGEIVKEKNIVICPDELTWRKRDSRSYNPRPQTQLPAVAYHTIAFRALIAVIHYTLRRQVI